MAKGKKTVALVMSQVVYRASVVGMNQLLVFEDFLQMFVVCNSEWS